MARKLRRRRICRPCGNAWSVQTGLRHGNAAQEGDCTKARVAHLFPRQANQTGASTSSRDRRRLARRPCSCCPARHPARIMAHRTGRDVLRVPLPAAGKQAGDAVGAVWIYRPRSRLFARHPSRIAAHRARCRRLPAASKPNRGQHLVAGSAAACAQAVQLLSGAPPCPYYGASDRTRCAPRAIARRWQAGRRRSGRGMDLQTAQPSLCASPFPYCGAQGAMQALTCGKQTKPGPASRRGIGGGLRAGRAAAVRRATLPVF